MRSILSRMALTGAVASLSVIARGQTSGERPEAPAAAAPNAVLSEVVVTGSRIITNGNDAPTPVTVVSPAQLANTSPTTVFQNLANLPMFSGSGGASNVPDNAPNANAAVSALNLRNLGPLRALVLMDGHRVPPTTADGLVDANMIPQMLLERVDVVTGGASAVYGSDAVTGVINFIPDRKFNGAKVELQGGRSTYNDDTTYKLGLAGGTNLFGDRGHLEVSFERYNDQGILFREDRPATRSPYSLQGDGSASDPFHLQNDTRIGNVTFGGEIVCPSGRASPGACPGLPLVGQTFDTNGVLTPRDRGSSTGVSYPFLQVGGDGAYHTGVSLRNAQRLDQLFGRFDYDITDNLHGFLTGSGAADHTSGYAGSLRSFPPGWSIGSCNAFLSAQYQQALGCTNQADPNQSTFTLSRMYNPADSYGLAQRNEIWIHNYFITGGLEGKFGDGYHWDATYTHSDSRTNTRGDENQNLSHLYAALDAVVDPATGHIVCNVTLTNPSAYPGCVPINVFGPTAPSLQALQYVFGRIETNSTNKLDDLSGSVSGSPFSDWAGPVQIALSGEARRTTYQMTSNSLPDNFTDCTPLRFGNCTPGATTIFINTNAERSAVHQTVEEGAVELNVPLLKEVPFARSLSFNSAARYTHYNNNDGGDPSLVSTAFNATTWKVGLTWTPFDWMTVRAARSRDIRAPNLYDLFNPLQLIPNQQVADYLVLDPATQQPTNVNPTQRLSGNPHLKPEVAHTTTIGVVVRPLPELSMALDGYYIKIEDALAVIDGSTQFIQQACINSGGTSPLCALQTRPLGCCGDTSAANALTAYSVEPYNIATQKTWGLDFETNYNARVLARNLSLRALVTWQPHLDYLQPSINFNDQAGASYNSTYLLQPAPVWKASVFAHYELTQTLGIDVQERYRSPLHWSADPTQYSVGGVASVAYTNATVTLSLPHVAQDFNVFVNVQNLFNKQPPLASAPQNAIFPGIAPVYVTGDDVVGRYWTVGIRARF